MKIAHIINPVNIGKQSDLYIAQPITFESMRIAQQAAVSTAAVELWTTQYPEDRTIIPSWFKITSDLERSIIDLDSFESPRKLPLLKDILLKLYQHSTADYFIYTNVDIGVQPHFYTTIAKLIDKGYDCFTINRRTITGNFTKIEELPLMYKEKGQAHPGHDCFVFNRTKLTSFEHCNACIGVDHIGKYFLFNLIALGHKFHIFEDQYLTFHIGDDRSWKNPKLVDYEQFNKKEVLDCAARLMNNYPKLKNNSLFQFFYWFLEEPGTTFWSRTKRKLKLRYLLLTK